MIWILKKSSLQKTNSEQPKDNSIPQIHSEYLLSFQASSEENKASPYLKITLVEIFYIYCVIIL